MQNNGNKQIHEYQYNEEDKGVHEQNCMTRISTTNSLIVIIDVILIVRIIDALIIDLIRKEKGVLGVIEVFSSAEHSKSESCSLNSLKIYVIIQSMI